MPATTWTSLENSVKKFYNDLPQEVKTAGTSALISGAVTTVISGFNPAMGIIAGVIAAIGSLIEAKIRPLLASFAQQHGMDRSLLGRHIALFSCSFGGPLLSIASSILGSVLATSFVNTLDPLQGHQKPNFYVFRC